jgi:hypothetical protein
VGQASAGHCPPSFPPSSRLCAAVTRLPICFPPLALFASGSMTKPWPSAQPLRTRQSLRSTTKPWCSSKHRVSGVVTPAHTTLCLSVQGVLPALQVCSHAVTGRPQLTLSAAMCMALFDRSDFSSV